MQKLRVLTSPVTAFLWLAAGSAWFVWHGWQAVHRPSSSATPGYFDWFRYLDRLTPTWMAALILALLVMLAGGWLLWRSARFDRWLAAATLVGLLALALRRPAVNGLSLLMLVVLAAVTAAAGRGVMRRLGLSTDETAATLFFAWIIGCGLLILTALALGLLHALSVWTLGAALLLGALLSRRDLRWLVQSALAWRPALPAGSSQRLVALALAPFALLDLLGALAPSAAFDATWYHLFIPRLFLQAGSLAYFPAHYRSLWPSNVEMLNLWGLALAGDQLAQLIGLGLTLLLLLGVFVVARAWFGAQVGLLAVLLLFATPDIATYAPSAYVDIPLALFLLAAALAWLRWHTTGAPGWLLIAALSAGLAAGAKLLGWPYLALFGLATLARLRWRTPAGSRGRLLAAVILVAALPSLPWLIRAWILGGDPMIPFGYRWFAETTWNRCADLLHRAHFAYVGVGRVRSVSSLGIALQLVALYASGIWLSLAWPLTLLRLLGGEFGDKRRLVFWLLAAGALLTVVQAVLFPMPRFFVMAQAVGAIVAAACTWPLLTRGRGRARAAMAILLVFVTMLGLAHAASARFDAPRVVLGLESESAALSRGLPEYAAMAWANQHLPINARVLNWSLRGSFLARDQAPVDPAFQGLLDFGALTDAQRFLARLRALGITHLLVLPDGSQFFYPEGNEVAANLDAFLAAVADRLTLLHEENGTRLYALDTQGSAPPIPLPGLEICR